MFKHNLKKVFIVFMMFTLVNMFAGCNDNKDITSSESLDKPIEYVQSSNDQDVYDFTACDGSNYQILNPNVQLYSPGFDPDDRIYQVFYKDGVQRQVQYFEEQGYEFRPEHSLVFNGEVIPEGTTDTFHVEVVELIMSYIEDTMKQVAQVTYSECEELGHFVQSSITSFVVPDDLEGYEEIYMGKDSSDNEVYVYVKDFEPSIAFKATSSISTSSKDYWKCVKSRTAIACGFIALGCLASGPGWAACTANGCAIAAAASAVGCAISYFF